MLPFSYAALVCVFLGLLLGARALRDNPMHPFNRAVAFQSFVYAGWAFTGVWIYGTQDSGQFWFFYHLGSLALLTLLPCSLWAGLVLSEVSWRTRILVVAPFAMFYATVFAADTLSPVFYAGFRPSPLGNIGILNPDLSWVSAVAQVLTVQNLLTWVWMFVARRRQKSRRVRLQLAIMLGASIVFSMISVTKTVIASGHDWPEADLFLGVLNIGLIYFLAIRYKMLDPERLPQVHDVLEVMKDAVTLVDPDLRIRKTNAIATVLLGINEEEVVERDVASLVTSPESLRQDWLTTVEERRVVTTTVHLRHSGRCELNLTPIFDDFHDLVGGVLVFINNDAFDVVFSHFGISPRERDIALMVIQGYQSKEIADKKFISVGTVKTHIHNLYEKTGASNRVELLRTLMTGPFQPSL